MTSDGTRFYAITNDLPIKNYTASEKANILCTKYESTPFNGMSALNKVIASYKSGSNVYVSVIDTSYTTKDSFKASVSGVYLYYELATEITRDNNSANVLATIGTTTNLLNPTLQSQVVNGITCTNNGDGTFTLNNSTATTIGVEILVGTATIETAKIVGCPKSANQDYGLRVKKGTAYNTDYGDGRVIEFDGDVSVYIYVKAGVSLNNVVFKPMITTNLSASYNDFVPFTGTTGKLNGDVAELTKIVKNVLNSGSFLCDVVANQANYITASNLAGGTFPSKPTSCVFNVSGFYSNIDYDIKIVSDSNRFIILPTKAQRISVSWIELSK